MSPMKTRVWLIVLLLIIVSIIVTLNLSFYQSYQSEMATQINKQQVIIARTVASSIKETVEHFKEETVDVAGLLALRGLKSEGMDEFFARAFTELRESVRTHASVFDEKGANVFSTWEEKSVLEYGRGYAKNIIRLNFDEVITDNSEVEKGFMYIWTPILKQGRTIGALMVGISIDDIANRFLLPVKSGLRGYAWMMNGSGTLMYHPKEPGMVGKNINKHEEYCFECHTSFNTEKRILASTDVGSSSYVAPGGEDKLVAFSWIEPLHWVICVSIPYSEVTASINNSMRLHSLLVISIFVSTVIGAAVIIVINRGRVKAEAKARYADRVKEYADELENIVQERTKELRSEKEKLDAVISSLHGGICIFEKDPGCSCVWMNDVMRNWVSEDRVSSFNISAVFGDEEKVKQICGTVEERKLAEVVSFVDMGGKKGFFQVTTTLFKDPDGTSKYLMLLQDVSELKKAEEQLMHSEKLNALARLSAGVAHEIGNPLTSISSYVQILKGMEADEFKIEALDTISRHIKRIVSIVKEMSEFSKSKAGEAGHCDIRELVDSTVELVRYDKRAKKMKITVSLPDELPKVNVDGNQLVQVFMNLILNASDAMQEGGILTIQGANNGRFVEISFADTGQGIEKEHLDRIFDPFFTTKDTGTGLGLSVSYGIIKSIGGDITVESEPGKGSVFKVKVPVYET